MHVMKKEGETLFQEEYKKLNDLQRQAVDTVEGPVMVIAGPGTGKTTILTLRIANILRKTDAHPSSILALTFTESGVHSMRRKLSRIIGSDAYKIKIATFHGFCEEIIQTYPEEFPLIIGSNNITEIDQMKMVESIIENADLNHLRPYGNPLFYVRPVIGMIRDLKREDISPDEFESIIDKQKKEFGEIDDLHHEKGAHKGKMKGKYRDLEKSIEKNEELLLIYRTYQKRLREENMRDFEDMIMVVVNTLSESEDLRLRLQEEYQYVLADEHQDANRAQNELLEHLTSFHDNPNLFIVGDEKQAIFRFQGASLENFLYFKERYPQSTEIILEDNFRSTQQILDVTHSLIVHNPTPFPELRAKLTAFHENTKKGVEISLHEFHTEEDEHLFIAEDIEKRISSGTDPNEIAVLYRNNRDLDLLLPHIEALSIPFVIESKSNVFDDMSVRKVIGLLQAIGSFGNDELLSKLLHIDIWGFDSLDVYKIDAYRKKERLNLYDVVRGETHLKKANVERVEDFLSFFQKLKRYSERASNEVLVSLFPDILSEFNITQYLLSSEGSLQSYRKIRSLFDEIKILSRAHRNYMLDEFLEYVAAVEEHNTDLSISTHTHADEGVRLMTAHRSKGLEFDYVYITQLVDKHWGNRRSFNFFHVPVSGLESLDIDRNEDERRLLYVAMTRARKEIIMSYGLYNLEGKEMFPSQFLEELDPTLIRKHEHDPMGDRDLPTGDKKRGSADSHIQEYVRSLFLEQGFSVSALNNYLVCPWRYFYRNLLRVPETPARHQLYGIAVHEALRFLFESMKRGEQPGKKELLSFFKNSLYRSVYSDVEYQEGLKKGEESLSGYFDTYNGTWEENVVTEYRVSGVPFTFEVSDESHDLILTGIIDKVEIIKDGKVNVVDYKTGSPKSRNAIEGKTKNSNGDQKRQLVFYKLLLDRYAGEKWEMVSGELDFVEPNSSGKYKKEQFEIDNEECKELEELIGRVAGEITTLSFWGERCNEKDCEYCRMRDMES